MNCAALEVEIGLRCAGRLSSAALETALANTDTERELGCLRRKEKLSNNT